MENNVLVILVCRIRRKMYSDHRCEMFVWLWFPVFRQPVFELWGKQMCSRGETEETRYEWIQWKLNVSNDTNFSSKFTSQNGEQISMQLSNKYQQQQRSNIAAVMLTCCQQTKKRTPVKTVHCVSMDTKETGQWAVLYVAQEPGVCWTELNCFETI